MINSSPLSLSKPIDCRCTGQANYAATKAPADRDASHNAATKSAEQAAVACRKVARQTPDRFEHRSLRFCVAPRRSAPPEIAFSRKRTPPAQHFDSILALITTQRADLIQQTTPAFSPAKAVACPGLFEQLFSTPCAHFQRQRSMRVQASCGVS